MHPRDPGAQIELAPIIHRVRAVLENQLQIPQCLVGAKGRHGAAAAFAVEAEPAAESLFFDEFFSLDVLPIEQQSPHLRENLQRRRIIRVFRPARPQRMLIKRDNFVLNLAHDDAANPAVANRQAALQHVLSSVTRAAVVHEDPARLAVPEVRRGGGQ